ncbi:DUF3152 domain-containing protein [Streptomyces sp. MUM 178J]|uniref:DUF3152 domain-containing protein n=1 Tax=Streptomyces sp. MUM 178J TaxID=2791991 RepID=UPI001F03A3C7|nr:DUF3152 domain-containing protein [Streptomyces sp. MUM 178J]WRQ82276.1 DUF3152 domain-containing protein [Streptomyces sp. MUM 178J]
MGKRAASRQVRSRAGVRRRPFAPTVLSGVALGVLSLGGGAALAHWQGTPGTVADDAPRAAATEPRTPSAPASQSPPGATASAGPSASGSSGGPDPSKSPDSSPSTGDGGEPPPSVPDKAKGTFTTARSSGSPAGEGPLRRYQVLVEDGLDLSASQAATEVEAILAHPRGWGANGRGTFQLVSAGEPADFVIKIATPDTADRLCLAVGLDTGGELNCETVEGVVVNLKRWLLGSPTFAGTPAEYRHLIINHEVGHEIGIRQHMGCPGPGKPAPVMMQQIKGLNGCVSNAWPYDENGTYLTGPTV